MTIGIVGRKSGMTRIFTDDGVSIPVSVIEVVPNRVTQVKNVETDGYSAVQVTVGSRRASASVVPLPAISLKLTLKLVVVCGSCATIVKKILKLVARSLLTLSKWGRRST